MSRREPAGRPGWDDRRETEPRARRGRAWGQPEPSKEALRIPGGPRLEGGRVLLERQGRREGEKEKKTKNFV